jgi:hypothetical protein
MARFGHFKGKGKEKKERKERRKRERRNEKKEKRGMPFSLFSCLLIPASSRINLTWFVIDLACFYINLARFGIN